MTILLSLLLLFQSTNPALMAEYKVVSHRDRLAITVFDEPTLSKTVTVDSDSSFDFPLIGRVTASGMPLRQIAAEL